MALGIFYPNGKVEASLMYIYDNVLGPIPWNGQVIFSGTISVGAVTGTKTNNNAAPGTDNLGALIGVVSTTAMSYTAGNLAAPRLLTTGEMVVNAQVVNTTGATQAFNSGVAGVTVPRVVIASDNPVISGAVIGTANVANSQGTVTTTSTTLVSSRATRRAVMLTQLSTTAVYFGSGTVSTTTGSPLIGTVGAFVVVPTTAALQAVTPSGTASVAILEVYD